MNRKNPSRSRKLTKIEKLNRPTLEDLERMGMESMADLVLDSRAKPGCLDCGGTGEIFRPDRLRGGHMCHCCLSG